MIVPLIMLSPIGALQQQASATGATITGVGQHDAAGAEQAGCGHAGAGQAGGGQAGCGWQHSTGAAQAGSQLGFCLQRIL